MESKQNHAESKADSTLKRQTKMERFEVCGFVPTGTPKYT